MLLALYPKVHCMQSPFSEQIKTENTSKWVHNKNSADSHFSYSPGAFIYLSFIHFPSLCQICKKYFNSVAIIAH